MSILEKIQDTGGSALFASDMMSLLDLSIDEIQDPVRFERFKSVINSFKDNPHYDYIVKKITMNKRVDKLNHVFEYANLLKSKERLDKECSLAEEETNLVVRFASEKGADPMEMAEYKRLAEKRSAVFSEKDKLEKELSLYE